MPNNVKQKRLQILLKLFEKQIRQKIETEKLNISEKELLNKLSDYEITESGKYLEWMVKCYIANGFLYEDLYKVKETLEIFHENKMKLSKDKRDIQQYKTLAELWIEVKKFVEQKDDFLSTNEQKRKEKELAYSETEFFYEDDNVRLVAPLTDESSKWWGKGTRWCTAADKNNMFYEYFDRAPLLIFDFKDGEKWQLWMFEEFYQFMNENDHPILNEKIEEKWNIIKNVFIKLLEINVSMLKYIPENFITMELYKLAVNCNGLALFYVPLSFKTKELCEFSVQQNGFSLKYIPEELKTKEICEMAVQQNGLALEFVPFIFRTKELCEVAVKRNKLSWFYIPNDIITQELCKIAVKHDGLALIYIPEEFKTKELCKIAIKQNGIVLKDIPRKFKTKELCEMAIKQNGLALEAVSFVLKTKEICEMAVKNNGLALLYVPNDIITEELCELAVRQNGLALYNVPEKFRTKKICEIAVDNQPIIKDNIVEKNIDKYKKIFSTLIQKNNLNLGN